MALLLGCSQQQTSAPPENSLITEAKDAVRARLRDPKSADFGDLAVNSQSVVCGSVNAKNAYGGYVGIAAFWYDPKTKEAFLYDPDQDWGGKGYDAKLFIQKGCSIGSEEAKALEARAALDESNRRIEEMANE